MLARARAGDHAGALAILRELTTLARSTYVSPYDLALCHVGLKDTGAALNYLEDGYRERVMRIISIGDPELDHLRSEPRFIELTRKLRLPAPGSSRDWTRGSDEATAHFESALAIQTR